MKLFLECLHVMIRRRSLILNCNATLIQTNFFSTEILAHNKRLFFIQFPKEQMVIAIQKDITKLLRELAF